MSRVLVGGITPEGENLLTQYLNAFAPDTEIVPLKSVGLVTKLNNQGIRPEVLLIIIDETLYQNCKDRCEKVLSMPKVHKYVNDDGLKQFLISKFGKLDRVEPAGSLPPDKLMESNLVSSVVEEEDNLSVGNVEQSTDALTADYEAQITELKDKLAQSEMLVRNLTQQLQENNSEDEIAAFVARIKELEKAIETKNDEINELKSSASSDTESAKKVEEATAKVDELKKKLKEEQENFSALKFEKTKVEEQLGVAQEEVEKLKQQIGDYEDQLKALTDQVDELSSQVEVLKSQGDDAEGKIAELSVLQERINELEGTSDELAGAKAKVNDLELELNNLKIDYDDLKKKFDENAELLKRSEEVVSEKIAELAKRDANLASMNEDNERVDNLVRKQGDEISNLKADLEEKSKELSELKEKLAESEKIRSEMASTHAEELSILQDELNATSDKDDQISSLDAKIASMKSTMEQLNSNISDLKNKLTDKENEILKLKGDLAGEQEKTEVQTSAYDKLLEEKKSFEEKFTTSEEELIKVKDELAQKSAEIENLNSTHATKLAEKDDEINTLNSEKQKLSNKVDSLQEDLIEAKANNESVSRLESDLLEEKKKSARLAAEVDVYKKNDDSGKASELKIENAKLKAELEKQKGAVDSSEFESLKAELVAERERSASLELDLVSKDEELEEISNSIFSQMANLALPKVAYDFNIEVPNAFKSKFVCIASGSTESNASVYHQVRRTCMVNPKAHYLIVDLVTDSSIDRDFNIEKVSSPINWLNGAEPFKNFVTNTKFPNVKAMSTALAYLNDLFLLGVDWVKRLKELDGYADVVFINIGCLNNTVSKILFGAFSKVMTTFVVTKATPLNLRTVILNLTGFKKVSDNVTVACVNFDSNASQAMYKRVVQKYKAQILKDSDTLPL